MYHEIQAIRIKADAAAILVAQMHLKIDGFHGDTFHAPQTIHWLVNVGSQPTSESTQIGR